MSSEINWLLLSDLHIGGREEEIFDRMTDEFWLAIRRHKNSNPTPPQLILITGDITYSGKPEEFILANKFFNQLEKELKKTYGPKVQPLIIPVPGNHDLIRPQGNDAFQYYMFSEYALKTEDDQYVKLFNNIFTSKVTPNMLTPLFSGYIDWCSEYIEKLKNAGAKVFQTNIPGDICVLLDDNFPFPLCVFGMNSTWLQFSDADFQEKLSISPRQYFALIKKVKSDTSIDFDKSFSRALFMMHHPPSWLSYNAKKSFSQQIYNPNLFDICLYGHMHKAQTIEKSINAGPSILEFQSPSLCGIEHYGKSNEDRSFGFSFGSISEHGEIRIWPYEGVETDNNVCRFTINTKFLDDIPNESVKGKLIKPGMQHSKSSTDIEGLFIRIVPIVQKSDIDEISIKSYLDEALQEIANKIDANLTIEPFECSSSKECVFYLAIQNDQSWSSLIKQGFKILLGLYGDFIKNKSVIEELSLITDLGFTMHCEEKGEEQFIVNKKQKKSKKDGSKKHISLPTLTRQSLLISDKIYYHLQSVLNNQETIYEYLSEMTTVFDNHKQIKTNITPIFRIPYSSDDKPDKNYSKQPPLLYNVCINSSDGNRIIGDYYLPSSYAQMSCQHSPIDQHMIELLIDAEHVWIVGVDNHNLLANLKLALKKRKELNLGFWEEIRVVFLARKLSELIYDQATKSWGMNVKSIREFLIKSKENETQNWDCLQVDNFLPFEANYFCDKNGNSTIQMYSVLPSGDDSQGICIEAGDNHAYHCLVKKTMDAILQTTTPIVEFNVTGHIEGNTFILDGLINQQNWREFVPPDKSKPCYPVSFTILYTNIDDDPLVLLQKRTEKNAGGDFDEYSVISGKVNDEDFDFARTISYKGNAYNTLDDDANKNVNMTVRLSRLFAKNIGTNIGNPIPVEKMECAWKNTSLREIKEKLGLDISPSRLKTYPKDLAESQKGKKNIPEYFILDKDDFFLYIKLFWLEISEDDLKIITQRRPNADLNHFDLDGLKNLKEDNELSKFLSTEFEDHILPLLKEQLKVK